MKEITLDNIMEAMEHGWIVSWSISRYIVGFNEWEKLDEIKKKEYIVKVRDMIYENQLMKSVLSSSGGM